MGPRIEVRIARIDADATRLKGALKQHDYPKFADQQLAERQAAGMSPFGFSALVRAEAGALGY